MPMFTQADLSLWEQECELVLNASEYEAYLDQLEAIAEVQGLYRTH